MDLNVDLNNLLPAPGTGSSEALDPTKGTLTTATKGQVTTSDTMTASTSTATTVTVTLEADNPVPALISKEGMEALLKLGTGTSTAGPGGPGGIANPWFQANPSVAFALAYLNYFAALREGKSEMANVMVEQIGVLFQMAKDSAALAIDSAKKEMTEHIINACMSGVRMGAAIANASIAGASIAKSKQDTPEMQKARTDVDTQEPNYKAVQDYKSAQNKMADNQQKIDALESKAGTGTPDAADATKISELKEQSKTINRDMQEAKAKLDAKSIKEADFDKVENDYNKASERFSNAERRHTADIERENFFRKQLVDVASNAFDAASSGAKAWNSMEKGLVEAERQILEGSKEVQRRLNDAVLQSVNASSEEINSLVQAIKKYDDARIQATAMTRN